MRTVSFSQADVRDLLNSQFVNTFTNTTGDPTAGQSIRHTPKEPAGMCIRGNGQQNVQTIFLTPKGDIFHAATGFLSSEDLIKEANYALNLFNQLQSNSDDSDAAIVANAHQQRLQQLGLANTSSRPWNSMMPMSPVDGHSFRPNQMFQHMIDRQIQRDNQFSVDRPLLNYRQLENDPTPLVGNGKTFFSSSSSGFGR